MQNKLTVQLDEQEVINVGFNRGAKKYKGYLLSSFIPLILIIPLIFMYDSMNNEILSNNNNI